LGGLSPPGGKDSQKSPESHQGQEWYGEGPEKRFHKESFQEGLNFLTEKCVIFYYRRISSWSESLALSGTGFPPCPGEKEVLRRLVKVWEIHGVPCFQSVSGCIRVRRVSSKIPRPSPTKKESPGKFSI
jgi:hypothetical protein